MEWNSKIFPPVCLSVVIVFPLIHWPLPITYQHFDFSYSLFIAYDNFASLYKSVLHTCYNFQSLQCILTRMLNCKCMLCTVGPDLFIHIQLLLQSFRNIRGLTLTVGSTCWTCSRYLIIHQYSWMETCLLCSFANFIGRPSKGGRCVVNTKLNWTHVDL